MCVVAQGGIFENLFYRAAPYQLTEIVCMKLNLDVKLIIKCV